MAAAFQFVSLQAPALTARLVRASAGVDAAIVLDLEDSLWDVDDAARTRRIKAEGRQSLMRLVAEHAELWQEQRVGVRVNRVLGDEWAADLRALAEASRAVTFDCIVLTKLEVEDELESATAQLRAAGVAHGELVPIVETVDGLANLDAVARGARRLGMRWLVYGHYDYSLDAGWWPFPEPTEEAFWRHVEPVIRVVEGAGLSYVQPPFFRLGRDAEFAWLLDRLARACRRDFGIITLGTRQTALAAGSGRRPSELAGDHLARTNPVSPAARARAVIDAFAADRRPTMSFAIDRATGDFLSPHMLLAARNYLGRGA